MKTPTRERGLQEFAHAYAAGGLAEIFRANGSRDASVADFSCKGLLLAHS